MCIISTKNLTTAQIAKKLLKREGIDSSVVNVDPNLTRNGCSFGLSFKCAHYSKASAILNKASISFGDVGGIGK